MKHDTKCFTTSFLAITLFSISQASLVAQSTPPSLGPVIVTIMAQRNLPEGAHVQIARQASPHREFIFVDILNVTPADLAAGLALLSGLRSRFGDALQNDVRAVPSSHSVPDGFASSEYGQRLAQQLARLVASPERYLPGVGCGKSIRITLPPPRGRRTAAVRDTSAK